MGRRRLLEHGLLAGRIPLAPGVTADPIAVVVAYDNAIAYADLGSWRFPGGDLHAFGRPRRTVGA